MNRDGGCCSWVMELDRAAKIMGEREKVVDEVGSEKRRVLFQSEEE